MRNGLESLGQRFLLYEQRSQSGNIESEQHPADTAAVLETAHQ